MPTDAPERLGLCSLDVAADNMRQLRRLFPEVFTESSDADENPAELDFEKLKAMLGEGGAVAEAKGGDDALKVNALETFRACQPEIQFRTV